MFIESIPEKYTYKEGSLFIGQRGDTTVGIKTPRHAITFAGARSGKGVACIIPNLKRWPENTLVIDPKGEAAETTCLDREAMGQDVYVLDPFRTCNVEERFRAAYNPLDDLDTDSLTIREDIRVIADGLVMRHDPKHALWDNNGQNIITGLIAFVKLAEPDNANLIRVREILRTNELFEAAEEMEKWNDCGGVMQTAAGIILADKDKVFVNNARENTEWLDSKAMIQTLKQTTFQLSELKTGNATVYLVLPPEYLTEHGRFLRLFVRTALKEMARKVDGQLLKKRCLFILDEFFSLGRIDEIQKSCGLLPGMGVHLWPFLQDLNQLTTLYGQEGAGTFFGNSDLHQFFGNTDLPTLTHMSTLTGNIQPHELGLPPPAPVTSQGQSIMGAMMMSSEKSSTRVMGAGWGALSGSVQGMVNAAEQADYQDQMNLYQQRQAMAGKPRVTPDAMADRVKRSDDDVADAMFCVLDGSSQLFLNLLPYFRGTPKTQEEKKKEWLEIAELIHWDDEKIKPWQGAFQLCIPIFLLVWIIVFFYNDGIEGLFGSNFMSREAYIIIPTFWATIATIISYPFLIPVAKSIKNYMREEFYKDQHRIYSICDENLIEDFKKRAKSEKIHFTG